MSIIEIRVNPDDLEVREDPFYKSFRFRREITSPADFAVILRDAFKAFTDQNAVVKIIPPGSGVYFSSEVWGPQKDEETFSKFNSEMIN